MFKSYGVKNITVLYIVNILFSTAFIASNWLFFEQTYLSNKEIGIVETVAVFLGILTSIPSGAFADLLGKKKMLLASFGLFLIGISLIIFFRNLQYTIIGTSVIWVGISFYEASFNPIVFDSLKEVSKEKHFANIISNITFLSTITTIITGLIGGYLYRFNIVYPWFIWLVFLVIGFFANFFLSEPKIDTYKFSLKQYFKQLAIGFQNLLSASLVIYAIAFIVVLGVFKTTGEGMSIALLAGNFGFDGETFGYVLSAINFLLLIFVYNFSSIRKVLGDFRGISILIILLATCLLASSLVSGAYLGFMVIFLIMLVGRIVFMWSTIYINEKIPSSSRSTTVSTFSMILKFPYALSAIFVGLLADAGKMNIFFNLLAVLLAITALIFIIMSKRKYR